MKTILSMSLLALTLLACKKNKENPPPDVSAFFVPAEGDTIHGGNPFAIDGTLTSDQTLLGYHISVVDLEGDSTLFQHQVMESATTYTVHEMVPHFFDTLTKLKLEVTIYADGLQGKNDYSFYYLP